MKKEAKSLRARRISAFYIPFVLYIVFITVLLVTRGLLISLITGSSYLSPQSLTRRYNLIPFSTISMYSLRKGGWFASLDITGNILLTVPMGIYIHALRKNKSIIISVLISLLAICGIESMQYVLATGSFDVDDIILNLIGAALGVLTCQLIYSLCKKNSALTRLVLSAISITLIPMIFATLAQDLLWLPDKVIFPACIAAFTAIYICFYFLFFRRECRSIKTVYAGACIVFSAMFLFVVLPMVSPGGFGGGGNSMHMPQSMCRLFYSALEKYLL